VDVISIDQTYIVILDSVIPKSRIVRLVPRKFRDVRVDDVPDNSSALKIRSITIGDNVISDVDNGGYNVQPVPVPNSVLRDADMIVYDMGINSSDRLLILGYTISDVPKYSGINIFPIDPKSAGITKKKIISNPCKVIVRL
jgi:hypothetical protein